MAKKRATKEGAEARERRAAFVARLEEAMARREMSQNALGDAIREWGLNGQASTVNGWLRPVNPSLPRGEFLLVLPEVLHVNGHWLLTGRGPQEVVSSDGATERIVAETVAFARDLAQRYGAGRGVTGLDAETEQRVVALVLDVLRGRSQGSPEAVTGEMLRTAKELDREARRLEGGGARDGQRGRKRS